MWEKIYRLIDERFKLDDVREFLEHKCVPVGGHATIWYYFGGVTIFFFTVQIITGVLLLMYYQAGENTSYESMKFLVGKVPFGWLIRSIHCWSAHLMCMSVLVHMFSVFFTKSYRKPREVTWFTGFALVGVTFTFGFSGYLLPWNELSYFATAVGTDSVKSVPLIGNWLLEVMRGGPDVSINTLYRFFALHVCILPLVTFGLIGLHTALVQRQGMAEILPHGKGSKIPLIKCMRFFPNFAMRDMLLWVICLNVLAILAVLVPYGPGIPGMEWELGLKADPLKPAYPGIKPEWYFLWMYQLLKEFPPHLFGLEGPQVCLMVTNVLVLIWFLVPVLDRRAARGEPSPGFTEFGVGALLFVGYLTLKAWDLNQAATIIVGIAIFQYLVRRLAGREARLFSLAMLPALQAALNSWTGLAYLKAGLICLILLAAGGIIAFMRNRRGAGTVLPALCMLCLLPTFAIQAAAQDAVVVWPDGFNDILQAEDDGGKPIIGKPLQDKLAAFPGHTRDLISQAY
ncbi:cytochrome bc complex cytochrome b subunit, partial [Acidobacteriota bacterium]